METEVKWTAEKLLRLLERAGISENDFKALLARLEAVERRQEILRTFLNEEIGWSRVNVRNQWEEAWKAEADRQDGLRDCVGSPRSRAYGMRCRRRVAARMAIPPGEDQTREIHVCDDCFEEWGHPETPYV